MKVGVHFDSDLFWIPYYDRVPSTPILSIGSVQIAKNLLATRPNDVYIGFNKAHKINGRLYILHLNEIDDIVKVHTYWIDFGATEWLDLDQIKVPLWTADLNRPSNLAWINFSCGRDALLPNQPISVKLKGHKPVQNFEKFKNMHIATISCCKNCTATDIWRLCASDDIITGAYTPPPEVPFKMYQTKKPQRQYGTFILLQQMNHLYNPNDLLVTFTHDETFENGDIVVTLDFEDERSGLLIKSVLEVPREFHLACKSASMAKLNITGFIRWDSKYKKWFASMPELR